MLPGAPVSFPPCPASIQSVNFLFAAAMTDAKDIMKRNATSTFFNIDEMCFVFVCVQS